MLNGKAMIILLTVGLIKKTQYNWVIIFQKPKYFEGMVKVKVDWSNYARQEDLNNATGVDKSDFPKEDNLGNLKSDVN